MGLSRNWQTSTKSGTGGECVECRDTGEVEVRDSKDPKGPSLLFTHDVWTAFMGDLRAGRFRR